MTQAFEISIVCNASPHAANPFLVGTYERNPPYPHNSYIIHQYGWKLKVRDRNAKFGDEGFAIQPKKQTRTFLLLGDRVMENETAATGEGEFVIKGRNIDELICLRCKPLKPIRIKRETIEPILDTLKTQNEHVLSFARLGAKLHTKH